jgi:hypothetical protein
LGRSRDDEIEVVGASSYDDVMMILDFLLFPSGTTVSGWRQQTQVVSVMRGDVICVYGMKR